MIRPGEIQFMRAGTGVTHSEYNASKSEPVHFLQIWIVPDARGLKPAYGQLPFDRELARQAFVLLASNDGRDGSIQVQPGRGAAGRSDRLRRAPGAGAAARAARLGARRTRIGHAERDRPARGRRCRGQRGRAALGFACDRDAEVLVFDLA